MPRWCWAQPRGTNALPGFRERINHAIALYQSRRVGKIVFTGGRTKRLYDRSRGRAAVRAQTGVAARNILFENTSRNTYENLNNIRPVLRANGIASVVIVSDPYHLARAAEMAEIWVSAFICLPRRPRGLMREIRKIFMLQEGMRYPSTVWKNGAAAFGMAV